MTDELKAEIKAVMPLVNLRTQNLLTMLSREIDRLREVEKFAARVINGWPDGGLDGFDLQDIAVTHGILIPEQRTGPCVDDPEQGGCNCYDYGATDDNEFTCYRLADGIYAAMGGEGNEI